MNTDRLPHIDGHQPRIAGAPAAPPIDVEILFSRCMNSASFALALLGELQDNGRQQVDAIALHATNDRLLPAAELAHSLKGAAAIIGAEPLRGKAAEIEEAGRAGEATHLLEMAYDLQSEMERCLTFISGLMSDLQQR